MNPEPLGFLKKKRKNGILCKNKHFKNCKIDMKSVATMNHFNIQGILTSNANVNMRFVASQLRDVKRFANAFSNNQNDRVTL